MLTRFSAIVGCILLSSALFSQEGLRPLGSNLGYIYPALRPGSEKVETPMILQKPAAPVSFSLPFTEDFYYSPVSNYPDPNKWEDSLVYVNSGMATAPPSIGVATFDGLNKHGYPYNPTLTNLTLSYPADKLTSKPINLYLSGTQTLNPNADVALSFYYQARGKGDGPEVSDSLVVDFYKPLTVQDSAQPDAGWQRVWFATGNVNSNTNDSTFKRAFIEIKDTAYFHDGFRFRFRNWASVTGNFDHWHIDYIYLDKTRGDSLFDTVRNDLTFGDIPTPFLRDYSEMPLQQYAAFELAQNLHAKIRNNGANQLNMGYKYRVYDQHYNQLINSYDGGLSNLNPFWPNIFTPLHHGYSNYAPHAHPPVQFSFTPSSTNGAEFPIRHSVFVDQNSSSSDIFPQNDTLTQYLRFRNFYAFDDGSAEAGYYVNSVGAQIAVKIRLNVADSLVGLRIYFDPVGNVSSISNTATSVHFFTINVWAANNDGTPNPFVIYNDSVKQVPSYLSGGFKEVPEFKLRRPLLLPAGTYYIGIKQAANSVTIGYDRNYNHQASLYFDSGNGWEQSQEKGSIMMQPVFGHYRAIVGIDENGSPEKNSLFVYPNPSSGQFTIRSSSHDNTGYRLFNALGQLVGSGTIETNEHSVSTTNLDAGLYILVLEYNGRAVQQQKIIVQH